MKKADLTKLLVFGVIVCSISNALCCSPLRHRVNSKKDDDSDRIKRGTLSVDLPYDQSSNKNPNVIADVRVKSKDQPGNVIGIQSDLYKAKRNVNDQQLLRVNKKSSESDKSRRYVCYCSAPNCKNPRCIVDKSSDRVLPKKENSVYVTGRPLYTQSTERRISPDYSIPARFKDNLQNPSGGSKKIYADNTISKKPYHNDRPIDDPTVEPIEGNSIYLPIYSATQNKKVSGVQKYFAPTVRTTTTPKLIRIEDSIFNRVQGPESNQIGQRFTIPIPAPRSPTLQVNSRNNFESTATVKNPRDIFSNLYSSFQHSLIPPKTESPPAPKASPPPQKQQQQQQVTTLEDVENDDYKKTFNVPRTSTARDVSAVSRQKSTKSSVQTVDERPYVLVNKMESSNATKEVLLQKTIRKVINNFVPGKAQDLLANYNSENLSEMVDSSTEDFHPEIVDSPDLKTLFSLPEVEDMITDTASNFLTRLTNLTVTDDVHDSIKDSLHNVIDRIPRSRSAKAPSLKDRSYHENDKLNSVDSRVASDPAEEVSEKINSIIRRSGLGKQVAVDPLIQNLIVKTVKHSLDKERGVIDEATIRQVLDSIVRSIKSDYDDAVTRPTPSSVINVTKHVVDNNLWMVTQASIAVTTPSGTGYDTTTDLMDLDQTEGYNGDVEKIKDKIMGKAQNNDAEKPDNVIERKPIEYYSPSQTILKYMKNQAKEGKSAAVPNVNTRIAADDEDPKKDNKLKVLFEPNYNSSQADGTSDEENSSETKDAPYLGRLVPVSYEKAPQARDVKESGSSNLVYVGDGVRLPLAARTSKDGSIVLTLSDEVCKQNTHKKCPCCLPNGTKGAIICERRGDSVLANPDLEDKISRIKKSIDLKGTLKNLVLAFIPDDLDLETKSSTKVKLNNNNNNNNNNVISYNVESSKNNNGKYLWDWMGYQAYGPPYKYQRYAVEDDTIRSRTEIIKNMLHWVKDVVKSVTK